VVTVVANGSQGAGFVFGAPNRVLTNAHVVGASARVEVVTSEGRRVVAVVVSRSEGSDLAALSVPLQLVPLRPRREPPRAGEDVIAIGSPLGLRGSVSKGVVSAVNRETAHGPAIQTDIDINPGNSGGPLLDRRGQVLGVNSEKARSASGIAFAVPIGRARQLRSHTAATPGSGRTPTLLIVSLLGLVMLLATTLVTSVLRSRRSSVKVRLRSHKRARRRLEPEPGVVLKSRKDD
jgi:S1-C subfamily serine protease